MKGVVIVSGINRPFAPIDRSVVRALKQCKVSVDIVRPGGDVERRLAPLLAAETQPDFILVLMAWRLTEANWRRLSRITDIPKIVWFTDDPYYMDWSRHVGKYFDYVFTNEAKSVPVYRKHGCRHVHHLPLGVDATDFFPRQTVPERYRSDVLVLGTAFTNRQKWMTRLLPHLNPINVRLVGPGWEKLKLPSGHNASIRPEWVSIKEANAYYNGANIVLNLHRSPRDNYLRMNHKNVPATTPNNRTFEVAACAAFQIVEFRSDLTQLYPEPATIPSCRSPQECLELISHYLPRQQQRTRKSDRLFHHTRQNHQYTHRLSQILTVIGNNDSK